MTKEEAKAYIEKNGNAKLVIETLKAMKEEGVPITEEELDRRVKNETTRGMVSLELPAETPALGTELNMAEDQFNANTAYDPYDYLKSDQDMMTGRGGSGGNLAILMVALEIVGILMYSVGYSFYLKVLQTDPNASPVGSPMAILMWAGLALYSIILLAAMWRIFSKADKPGIFAIIPILNVFILYDVIFGRATAALRLLIPLYNIYWAIKSMLELARRFGKGTGFGVGLIFLSPIFETILGFDDSEYIMPL